MKIKHETEVLTAVDRVVHPYFLGSSKPYVRWWWLAGPFNEKAITEQLAWVRTKGFGGVEVAWIRPIWYRPNLASTTFMTWLGDEWRALVAFTKKTASDFGLGCDFTFGSCWPFGGTFVRPEHSLRDFDGNPRQTVIASWETDECRVIDHLNREALEAYADALVNSLQDALAGEPSALFCDSLELHTQNMWSPKLWTEFRERFGYELRDFSNSIEKHPDVRYDYRSLISDVICREFFSPFTEICHRYGAHSRVQCHGAPADLLSAYAAVDIPESESLLFPPHFSRIPASAAALAGKPVISAEMFTCLYGFPGRDPGGERYRRIEQIGDMKLLADAVFAHGVNHVVWHGMPFNPQNGQNSFYAYVHVGPDSLFATELEPFNRYLTLISAFMKLGQTYSELALYLPNEDRWMLDKLPQEERTPGATYYWEMRDCAPPEETRGFNPLWVSLPALRQAVVHDGHMRIGAQQFRALYVNSRWLNKEALDHLVRLGTLGLPIVLKQLPSQPGRVKTADYEQSIQQLLKLSNVVRSLDEGRLSPFLIGTSLPPFWARVNGSSLLVFFAHPATQHVRYPMRYGQSRSCVEVSVELTIRWAAREHRLPLTFGSNQSLLLQVNTDDACLIDTTYHPPEPMVDNGK